MFDVVTSLFSRHDFNPLNLNPLKDVLEVSVDFEALRRRACPIKLFLSANQRARPLPVQRLIPAELFEQDHRQQTWAREAAGVTWNGGRRLRVAAPCRQAVQRRGFMPFGLRCASMLCTAADSGGLEIFDYYDAAMTGAHPVVFPALRSCSREVGDKAKLSVNFRNTSSPCQVISPTGLRARTNGLE
jgi:hypothetical protein